MDNAQVSDQVSDQAALGAVEKKILEYCKAARTKKGMKYPLRQAAQTNIGIESPFMCGF